MPPTDTPGPFKHLDNGGMPLRVGIWAASLGDLEVIRRLVARGAHLEVTDYDMRTPLHLAAAEGHLEVVRYFSAQRIELNPQDRWGNTPLDDALRHDHQAVAELLSKAGGKSAQHLDAGCTRTGTGS